MPSACVNPWIQFATQFGTLVIMPGEEGLQDQEEDGFLDGLLPLSSCTSKASTTASTPGEKAKYGIRGGRVDEADFPGQKEGRVMAEQLGQLLYLSQPTWLTVPCNESGA